MPLCEAGFQLFDPTMKLVFAGTPEFSVAALDALHAAGHDIVGVYTQPDRPSGRGRKLSASPVAQRAESLGLPVFKPPRFTPDAIDELAALAAELMVVVAYGLILPQAVLDVPVHGCFNIHASLLPRWRGAAPIQRAILAGDRETGVTIMQMDAGLDTGPMLLREALPIDEVMNSGELHDRLAVLGARLIVEAVQQCAEARLCPQPQPAEGACYARKLSKEEARLDWTLPAETLARAVRAYNPAPMAWTELDGERVRILEARALSLPGSTEPGSVLASGEQGIHVATGDGVLSLQRLQWPGGKPLQALDAARGRALDGRRFS